MVPLSLKVQLFIVSSIALIGAAQIVSTYQVLSQTYDEPYHIGAGMEWIQYGRYTVEQKHPPFARIAVAIGPFIAGQRLTTQPQSLSSAARQGNDLLFEGSYFRNLALARLGILPFFFLTAALVWLWGRRIFGDSAALFATALFACLPPILAHAGLATTDMACAATFLAAVFTFTLWLDNPNLSRSCIFGVSLALAVLAKLSNLVFLSASLVVIVGLCYMSELRNNALRTVRPRKWVNGCCMFVLVAFFVMWSVYRFSTTSLTTPQERPHSIIDNIVGQTGPLHDISYAIVEAPVFPLSELYSGVVQLVSQDRGDTSTFFLGKLYPTGQWQYFLVMLAVKTPIPLIALFIFGVLILIPKARQHWQPLVPFASAVIVLGVSLFAHINLGVRHILPVYPLMSLVGGFGAAAMWQSKFPGFGHSALVFLLTWYVGSAMYSRPDFLAYFNEIAGDEPERIAVDSNVDWGQDLHRLSAVVKEMRIAKLSIAYYGSPHIFTEADFRKHGLPETQRLIPHRRTTGWVAVGLSPLKQNNGFDWLNEYRPALIVGKSMRLYYIPPESSFAKE